MILGLSSYSFTWAVGVPGHYPATSLSATGLLQYAKELGVSLVQIADNMPLHEMPEESLKLLVDEAEKMKIELEAGAKVMTPQNLERYCNIAEKIRSRILRFVIDGDEYRPGIKEIIAIIRNAEPEFRKRGIILALENHDRIFARQFADIIENINSNFVGICLDCANSIGAGEGFREVISTLAPHAVNFHLKEVRIKRKFHKMGFDVEGSPFGKGSLPLEWMLGQLPSKCRTAILEQWTPPEDSIDKTIAKEYSWAKQSIHYLRKYIKD